MFRRLFLVFLPILSESVSFADDGSWNCRQDKNTQQWICLGDIQAPGNQPASVEPPVAPPVLDDQPVVKARQQPPSFFTPAAPQLQAPPQLPKPVPVAKDSAVQSPEQAPTIGKVSAVQPPEQAPAVAKDSAVQPSEQTCGQAGCSPQPDSANGEETRGLFGVSLLSPAFPPEQEAIFRNLTTRFKADPWRNCLVRLRKKNHSPAAENYRQNSPLDVKSDYSEIFDNEIGNYYGDVEMQRADQRASSHTANYDSVSQTLELHGNVYYSENELAVHSDTATIKLASDQAVLRDTLFVVPETPLRGFAKAFFRDNKFLSRYHDVTYTSCRPGNQDWAIHASELKINKETGKGAAKNAFVEFKGAPIFYTPYLSFPTDNRRQSGFLSASYGTTQISGFNASLPYYWNIAPNYDATLTPRYFAKRGVLMTGNFRYINEITNSTLNLEYLPEDTILKKSRYLGGLKNSTKFTPNLYTNVDLNYVSDNNFFSELGNALISPYSSFVKSSADANYVREGLALTTRFETYQSLNSTLKGFALPYTKLPQVNLNLNHAFEGMPVYASLDTETVNFQHANLVQGQRINLRPSLSLPLKSASTYMTPKMSVQHSEYFLSNQAAGTPDQINRTIPIFSFDSGMQFERDVNWDGAKKTHTLEPRLFYLYVPRQNQSNIPVFDSSIYDFWFASLFRENRFSGMDRIQDANQVSAALTSRLLDPATGLETLKFNVGEIFYFQNRDVTAPYFDNGVLKQSPVETSAYSPLVGELSSQINQHIAVDSGLQWDPQSKEFVRSKATVHFVRQPGEVINLGYLYRKNPLVPDHSTDLTQTDFSTHWPIAQQWSVVGRWQYSWLYHKTQDGFLGLEKENCCWRFRVMVRNYLYSLNTTTIDGVNQVTGTSQTGVFFQLEFKGLSGVGEKLDRFFQKSVYGYEKPTL